MRHWSGFRGLGPPGTAAFFGLCYLYVWLRIEPYLIFHVQEPVFFGGWSFFADFLQIPGGITAYVAAFAGQSYAFGWLGALVITLVMAAIWLCAGNLVRGWRGQRYGIVTLTPVVLLLSLHNRYHYDLAFDLSLLVALAAATISTRLDRSGRTLYFVLIAPAVYWVSGGGWLLFALLCALRELVDRHTVGALARVAVGAVLPWLATLTVFPGTWQAAYTHQLPLSGLYLLGEPRIWVVAAALYLFLPVAILITAYGHPAVDQIRGLPSTAGPLLLIAVGGLLVYGTLDVNHRTMLEIDHQARRRNWSGVLSLVPGLAAYDVLTVYNVQLALCHTGKLGSDLFSYPYLANAEIFQPSPEAPSRFLVLGDNLIEMGYVNKAEHMLQEAAEIHGDRPSILRRLVTVNVLKDRPRAARVYLHRLAMSPLDRSWSEKYLAALDADPRRGDDEEISRLRGLMVATDYPGFFTPEDILRQLLERNPDNLLAFDLLMGHYLQTAQLEKIVQNLRRLARFPKAFPGKVVPRLYEEALMLWATQVRLQTGVMPELPLHGRTLSLTTQKRYTEFSQLLALHRGDPAGAKAELAKEHRDTFWYYYLYRGAEVGVPIVSRATRPVPQRDRADGSS